MSSMPVPYLETRHDLGLTWKVGDRAGFLRLPGIAGSAGVGPTSRAALSSCGLAGAGACKGSLKLTWLVLRLPATAGSAARGSRSCAWLVSLPPGSPVCALAGAGSLRTSLFSLPTGSPPCCLAGAGNFEIGLQPAWLKGLAARRCFHSRSCSSREVLLSWFMPAPA